AYFLESFQRDPITVLVILTTMLVFGTRYRDRRALAVVAGMLLYCAYVITIGGDFMSGRFLTAPFFAGVVLLVARGGDLLTPVRRAWAAGIATVVFMGSSSTPFRDVPDACGVPESGIVDERGCYAHNWLTRNVRKQTYKTHPYYKQGVDARQEPSKVQAEQ